MQRVENESMSLLLFGTGRPRVLQCLRGLNGRSYENRSINGCGSKVFQIALCKKGHSLEASSAPVVILVRTRAAFTLLCASGGSEQVARLLQLLLFSSLKSLPVQLPHVSGAVFLPPVSHREGFRRAPIAGMACSKSACFRKLRLGSFHQM